MASVGSVGSTSAATTASITAASESNTEVAVALLKKANDSDKNLVNTRLPTNSSLAGGLNIRDAAFARIFQTLGFVAHVLGDRRLHAIAASRCH